MLHFLGKTTLICFLLMALVFNTKAIFAQTEAEDHTHNFAIPNSDIFNTMNWTKQNLLANDSVTLYQKLDSGYVIVQEYFMLDCQPCITAAKGLNHILKGLKERFPNRILFYQTVYNNEDTAPDLLKWHKVNNIKTDGLFTQGDQEVTKYGGMGMPTIIILGGGKRHKGYYKKQGYSPLHNGAIIKAIRNAIYHSKNRFEEEKTP